MLDVHYCRQFRRPKGWSSFLLVCSLGKVKCHHILDALGGEIKSLPQERWIRFEKYRSVYYMDSPIELQPATLRQRLPQR
jgi:hypothetical protein